MQKFESCIFVITLDFGAIPLHSAAGVLSKVPVIIVQLSSLHADKTRETLRKPAM